MERHDSCSRKVALVAGAQGAARPTRATTTCSRRSRDALESFWTSPLDALVMGRYLVEKPAP